jgi:hypothetical protein
VALSPLPDGFTPEPSLNSTKYAQNYKYDYPGSFAKTQRLETKGWVGGIGSRGLILLSLASSGVLRHPFLTDW